MKVYNQQCKNCLLSENAIVSPDRRRDIIQQCATTQNYFICHKASMQGKDVCCKKFYDQLGHTSQLIRIAQRLNVVEFIDQPDTKKLPTYKEINP